MCYSDAVQMQYIDTGSDAVAAMLMYSQQKVMIESLGIGCIVTPYRGLNGSYHYITVPLTSK